SWIFPGSMLGSLHPKLPNSRSRACCKKLRRRLIRQREKKACVYALGEVTPGCGATPCCSNARSEERRVGKEGRYRLTTASYQAKDGIRDATVTGVQTCALPISPGYFQARCWDPYTQNYRIPDRAPVAKN